MGLLDAFRKEVKPNLLEDVQTSITHLLSTKRSFGAWQQELGLNDYSYTNVSKALLRRIGDDIAQNIKTYEKRFELESVEVVHFKSFSDFSYKLEGQVEGKRQIFTIHITKKHGINVATEKFFR